MSTSLKPRITHSSADLEASHTTASTAAAAAASNDNEKEEKIQRQGGDKFRQWIALMFLLSVGGFILGSKQVPPGAIVVVDEATTHSQHMQHAAAKAAAEAAPLSNNQKYLGLSESELVEMVATMDEQVRTYKRSLPKGQRFMETDAAALKLTIELQQLTRALLRKRYNGSETFRVVVDLVFPASIPDYSETTKTGQLILEMAPIEWIPCSVYNFLEIARTWKSGSFHRNAGHVLQVESHSDVRLPMPFQEYSPQFPHIKGTVGYAGRPSGPGWYVSIQDNTRNHGPGTQQADNPNEADSAFGTVVVGMDDVVPRIHSVPQTKWLDKANQIDIPKMTIIIPDPERPSQWIPWNPTAE